MPEIIPPSFPALALAHCLALLSPGPDFFLITGHAVRHRLPGSIFICAGITLGNAIYIILAIAGCSLLRQSPILYRGLEIVGAAYLLWMGWLLIRACRRSTSFAHENAPSLSRIRQFSAGLASAMLNPKNAVFYLTLMTVIIGVEATLAQQVFSGIWMVLLVFTWDTAVAATIAHPGVQRRLMNRIPLVEGCAGVFLILLAFSFVIVPVFRNGSPWTGR